MPESQPRPLLRRGAFALALLLASAFALSACTSPLFRYFFGNTATTAYAPPRHTLRPEAVREYAACGSIDYRAPADNAAIAALQKQQSVTLPVAFVPTDEAACPSVILADGALVPLPAGNLAGFAPSSDGTAAACLLRDNGNADNRPALYLVADGVPTLVSGNVDQFYFSPYTKHLYYTRYNEDYTTTLYAYTNGRETRLLSPVSRFVLSQNERFLLFLQDDTLYTCEQGQTPTAVASFAYLYPNPLSIANDGTTFFTQEYLERGGYYYTCFTRGQEETGLYVPDADYVSDFTVGYAGKEALFTTSSALWRCSSDGGFVQVAGGENITVLCPRLYSQMAYLYSRNKISLTANLDSFFYTLHKGNTQLFLYTQNHSQQLAEGLSWAAAQANADGTALLYEKSNALTLLRLQNGVTTPASVAGEVRSFTACADFSHLYYIDKENTFYGTDLSSPAAQTLASGNEYYLDRLSADGTHCLADAYNDGQTHYSLFSPTGLVAEDIFHGSDIFIERVANNGTVIYQQWREEGSGENTQYKYYIYHYDGKASTLLGAGHITEYL